jgi:hypothetical protein
VYPAVHERPIALRSTQAAAGGHLGVLLLRVDQQWINASCPAHLDVVATATRGKRRQVLATTYRPTAGQPEMASVARKLVSKKKKRYVQDGFDLDLAYIVDKRIMAMGIPSEGAEAAFRNPLPEVVRFLHHFHPCDHHYVALRSGITVRVDASLTSDKVVNEEGFEASVDEGEDIVVTERKLVRAKTQNGEEVQVMRLRYERGWLSEVSTKGVRMMQLQGVGPAPSPLPPPQRAEAEAETEAEPGAEPGAEPEAEAEAEADDTATAELQEALSRYALQEGQVLERGRHFKVYNLCIEKDRQYDHRHFDGSVGCFPFYDHNCPPLKFIPKFCADAAEWLDCHESNMVAVHCKAGKSRTGLMIVCLLMHTRGPSAAPEACIEEYGERRTNDGKGVTIPSQHRYIHYYRTVLDCGGYLPPPRPMRLTHIKFVDVPITLSMLALADKAAFFPHFACHRGTSGVVGEVDEPLYRSW